MKNIIPILIFVLFSCNENEQNKEETPKSITINDTVSKPNKASDIRQIDSLDFEYSELIAKYPEFNGYTLNTESNSYLIKGDFFGDKTEDIAILIKDSTGTKIGIIDFGTNVVISIIGIGKDSLGATDYSWIGVFSTVVKGDVLWSNYVDDWRDLEDVPKSEKVILDYDAIYAHASESCGGGFIFWKDNKWNWLQQE